MQHAEEYQIIISKDKKLAVLLHPQKGEPRNSYLLYDGGDHAFLYRHREDVILLDYLNPAATDFLAQAGEILIIEADWEKNETLFDYIVKIKHEQYA